MTVLTAVPAVRPVEVTPVRHGAWALLVGGPLSLVFHVLWSIGHGPTVVNEHGVVLGLTNDQWSWLSPAWMALVAAGVVGVGRLHTGRRAATGVHLVLVGLLLSALATRVWVLFSVGLVLLNAGLLCLGAAVLHERVLPRWSGWGLLAAVVVFLPLVLAPGPAVEASVTAGAVQLESEDALAAVSALAWTLLGAGVLAVVRTPAGARGARRA